MTWNVDCKFYDAGLVNPSSIDHSAMASTSNQPSTYDRANLLGIGFALVGLAFSVYNAIRIVDEMVHPRPDSAFASAMLFFAMGMIPIVISLYILAALKGAMIEKVGAKTILILGVVLMVFLLFLWAVMRASEADVKSIMIGFILPMLLRASSQSPSVTVSDANQRIFCYFGGMVIGLGLNYLLIKGSYIDVDAYRTGSDADSTPIDTSFFFAICCVSLLAQLLQIGHVLLEFKAWFKGK